MRVGLGWLVALSVNGCTAGSPSSDIGTAIYVPPVRLGGTGSVMFLPASRPTQTLDSDEAVVRAVLTHVAVPNQCVDPVMGGEPLQWWADTLADSNDPEARMVRIKAGMDVWRSESGQPLDPAIAARIAETIGAITAKMPERHSSGAALPPDWLLPGQRIGRTGECSKVVLSRPVRRGMLSFIGVGISHGPLNGVDFALAMDRSGGTWRAIARQQTWVS